MLNPCLFSMPGPEPRSSDPSAAGVGPDAPRAISTTTTMSQLDTPPAAGARDRDYLTHRADVLRLLRARFGSAFNDSDREDVYHDAWVGLLEYQARGGTPGDVGGLLKTIAWRRGRDRLRNRSAQPSDPGDGPLSAALDERPTPDERAEVSLTADLCRELIDSLGDRQRAVLKLRCDWQLAPAEVQRALGMSAKTYEKQLTKALKRVAAAVAEVDDGTWHERRRALLLACEAGTATPEERERARRLVERDPAVRAMLRKIRGVAVLAPLPLLFDAPRGAIAVWASGARRLLAHRALGRAWPPALTRAGGGAGVLKAAGTCVAGVAAVGGLAAGTSLHASARPARPHGGAPRANVPVALASAAAPVIDAPPPRSPRRVTKLHPRPPRQPRESAASATTRRAPVAPPAMDSARPAPSPVARRATAPPAPAPRATAAPRGDGSHEFGP